MGTYFHGWRRKAGLTTLLFALAFTGGWVRGHFIRDELQFRSVMKNKAYWIRTSIKSSADGLMWFADKTDGESFGVAGWHSQRYTPDTGFVERVPDAGKGEWRMAFWGFEFGEVRGDSQRPNISRAVESFWIIPYWFVVTSLTLISAYLLYSKPRRLNLSPATKRLNEWLRADSSLGERFGWSVVCAVIGSGISLGLPTLLVDSGVPAGIFGQWDGIVFVPLILLSLTISGLAGLIAGFVRPGRQAVMWTMAWLVLTDIVWLAFLTFGNQHVLILVHAFSAALEVLWIAIVVRLSPKSFIYAIVSTGILLLCWWFAVEVILKSMIRESNIDSAVSRVTDDSLKDVCKNTNLMTLDLDRTSITDIGVKEIGKLTKLNSLYLNSTAITDEGLKQLEHLSELEILNLNNCRKITDQGLKQLRYCTNLRDLDLGATYITDEGFKVVGNLTKLTRLSLGGHAGMNSLEPSSQITNAGMKEVSKLKSLTVLSLVTTKITDEGLKEISDLTNLVSLNLWGTAISDAGLKELGNLEQLTTLDIGMTHFTPEGLKVFADFKKLKSVRVSYKDCINGGLDRLEEVLPNVMFTLSEGGNLNGFRKQTPSTKKIHSPANQSNHR